MPDAPAASVAAPREPSRAGPAGPVAGLIGKLPPRRLAILSVVLTIVGWNAISLLAGFNGSGDRTVPGIIDIVGAAESMSYYWKGGLGVEAVEVGGPVSWRGAVLGIAYNSLVTAGRVVGGFLIGGIIGLVLGALVSWSAALRAMVIVPAHFMRMMPLLAIIPLFAVWFGGTDTAAVTFIAFSTFVLIFPVTVNAIGSVPSSYTHYARSLGASRLRTYLEVVLPAALPRLRGGFVLALGFAWSAGIAAEYLGQQYGLGSVAKIAEFFGRTNTLALVGFLAAVYAALTFLLMDRFLGWLTRWAG